MTAPHPYGLHNTDPIPDREEMNNFYHDGRARILSLPTRNERAKSQHNQITASALLVCDELYSAHCCRSCRGLGALLRCRMEARFLWNFPKRSSEGSWSHWFHLWRAWVSECSSLGDCGSKVVRNSNFRRHHQPWRRSLHPNWLHRKQPLLSSRSGHSMLL